MPAAAQTGERSRATVCGRGPGQWYQPPLRPDLGDLRPQESWGSLSALTVNAARIEGWRQFLDEAEAVLEGRKLLPHWRLPAERGTKLKRVFTEPRTFDLVMWIHGAAAVPYLEEGDVVTPETARTISRTFQGRFVVFAIWFQ